MPQRYNKYKTKAILLFSIIICRTHCAGVTKCSDKKTFDYVNYLQTKYFIDTLKALSLSGNTFYG